MDEGTIGIITVAAFERGKQLRIRDGSDRLESLKVRRSVVAN